MGENQPSEATVLLHALSAGHRGVVDQLAPLVYDELRALARSWRKAGMGRGSELQTTALVHEAFIRLIQADGITWEGRAHFFAVGARAMRQILASHARRLRAIKRGGDRSRLSIESAEAYVAGGQGIIDAVALDDALERLTALDERQGRIVEMRFFAGMAATEIAHVLDVSVSTVEREWRAARAWLGTQLAENDP